MTSYSTRFRAGEHETVWSELAALGPVPAGSADDVADVAHETMRRVARHVRRIADALPELGFVPSGPVPAHAPPTGSETRSVSALGDAIGPLPAALSACMIEVGGVWWCGDCPALGLTYHDAEPPSGVEHPDPLTLPPVEFLREEWDERPEAPFRFAFAPDELHKANVSGGVHELVLPDGCADPGLHGVAGRPGITLVSYLRLSVGWGGFPGWSFASRSADVPAALERLRARPDF